ncbi:zinc finger CCCH domain-containing protein 11A [Xenentodon cancila]
MTNHGDDCYFYYYSTCSKGDSCPFRHCEAAMGNETVCSLWQEGRCFRPVCKFRHMEITKNRKEIPCYWENQPAGCQKPHCAFFHEKLRYIDGVFVPPNKGQSKNEQQQPEEAAPPPAAALPTTANPQLRGVIKTDNQEPVPSPTHPPVVINPADDDEDEDDQFSEEGEEGPSPRKLNRSGDPLNFGVSTLEEIRLRRALKASLKRAGYPVQSPESSANGEKENIQMFFQPSLEELRVPPVLVEAGRPRGSMVERLGRKIPHPDFRSGRGVQLRKSLAKRLGGVVHEEELSVPPQETVKSVKERLGLVYVPESSSPPPAGAVSVTAPEQIHIKTLEQIKLEKAAKTPSQKDVPAVVNVEIPKTIPAKARKGVKRVITVRDASVSHIKTFSEIIQAKKKQQEEEQGQNRSPDKADHSLEKAPGKSQGESDSTRPAPEDMNTGKVRVKTLQEIRREKAERLQAQQSENQKSTDTEDSGAKKPCLPPPRKVVVQVGLILVLMLVIPSEKRADEPGADLVQKSPAAVSRTSNHVKVKTFEEIIREKRLRKQEMEDQARSSAEAEPGQNRVARGTLKRKLLPLDSSSTVPARKIPSLQPKAPLNRAADAAATAASEKQSSSREVSAAPRGPAADPSQDENQNGSPEHTTNCKVRPKLNVKPSVMRPAAQVKPGQKKRGAEHSAVAAVKPLTSAPTVQEEPPQEPTCRAAQVRFSGSEPQLSSVVPRSPPTLQDSGCSLARDELQTVPTFKQSPVQDHSPAVRETGSVLQSPVLKTPVQSKPRRASAATTRSASTADASSAVDDFEELINQFSGDQPVEGVDPDIGEDDLLQELSEMIDS